jgi:hypothetical protein
MWNAAMRVSSHLQEIDAFTIDDEDINEFNEHCSNANRLSRFAARYKDRNIPGGRRELNHYLAYWCAALLPFFRFKSADQGFIWLADWIEAVERTSKMPVSKFNAPWWRRLIRRLAEQCDKEARTDGLRPMELPQTWPPVRSAFYYLIWEKGPKLDSAAARKYCTAIKEEMPFFSKAGWLRPGAVPELLDRGFLP